MLGHVAVGTWSGGRFMRFGEPISDERLEALLRPGGGIDTVLTADAYGAGEADALLAAPAGVPRSHYSSSAPSATTSTRASATAPRAFPASPTRGCAGPMAIATTSGWRSSGASSAAGRLVRAAAAPQPRPARLRVTGGLGRAA